MNLADPGRPAPPQLVSLTGPRILLGVFVILIVAALATAVRLALAHRDSVDPHGLDRAGESVSVHTVLFGSVTSAQKDPSWA